jgi:hypothetical protein
MTPCLSQCGREGNRCKGCYRTINEISTWSKRSKTDKAKTWLRLFLTTPYAFKFLYLTFATTIAAILIGFILACIYISKGLVQAARRLTGKSVQ